MPDFYQIPQDGEPHSRHPVPLQQPGFQGGHQHTAPMGMTFQQHPIDQRLSHQVLQQQPLRPVSQTAGHPPQPRPYSGPGSPQVQRSFLSFRNAEPAPQSHDDIIPDEFGRFIEVSDLTTSTFTEDKYYQYLSTPITIRFEKVEPRSKRDAAGVTSTWLNCTRTRLPNVDAVQADEEIQRLNRRDNKKGLTLMKKQQSLESNAQTQLTKAERDLSAAVQDRRFHIVLKQLDWTERSAVKAHGKGSKRNANKMPRKERASITAYFSRCPKPNQVPSALYRQLETERLQVQAESDQKRQERNMTARRSREAQDRDKREHEEKMAEHKARQEEAIANRIHEQRIMFQQQQQGPTSQNMTPGQSMHLSHQVPQHQTGPAPYGHPQGRPPMVQQQVGPLPQGYDQNRSPMGQQPGLMPQQYSRFQEHNGPQHGRSLQPLNIQATSPPVFRQMIPQQAQQAPSQHFRQTPPKFAGQHTYSNRPIITVVTEHQKRPKHKRGNSQSSVSSNDSSSGSYSVFDSDSEHSSASTKRSSLASGTSDSPHVTRIVSARPKKPKGGAGSRYIADSADNVVHDRRAPVTRRHAKAYIQTRSERKLEVPGLSSRVPIADPLTQVREAYLAGHADHERLVSEVNRSDTSATRYQPTRRLPPSEAFSEAAKVDTLPKRYQFRRLSRSGARGSRQPLIFQGGDLPRIRRVSGSEVGRELDRERGQDFGGEFSQRTEISGTDSGLRYDDRDLEGDFVARMRLSDERPDYRSSWFDGMEPNMFRERRRQRQRELFARDAHEDIFGEIGEGGRRQFSRSPERNPYIDVPLRSGEDRFDDGQGVGPRGLL